MQNNYMTSEDPLDLERIRSILIRLEDTIIFALIERAQFSLNSKIYERGAFQELKDIGFDGSWLEWFLKETESFQAKARRYTSPDEYPFTPADQLPPPILSGNGIPKILFPNKINVNPSIYAFYTRSVVPRITSQATLELASVKRAKGIVGTSEYEDDGNYGSTATLDIELLQAISKRVHYGKFVAESKFRSSPSTFIPHILKPNPTALAELITKPLVERAVLARLFKKASLYGQDIGADGEPKRVPIIGENNEYQKLWKLDVESVRELFERWIIPLTKEVEVEYLLHRLDGLSQEQIDNLSKK
ncbi:hypothetical protein BOTBODRAFT_68180 [Botryobasidium botryosum FD-172 SS1]|uniref:Chorismate mutase n=1 Tax=Botryobasidium botryosum (strain FD-172 SS1) TaxID=930990 RepID=A0A067M5J9_BOTB1|nr:hypothetical protein BOTBODRAFT_68180 [Botryobasidium botryosum FD-172 SS1]